jgi:nucleoside-diphosphate-sugar epimerase
MRVLLTGPFGNIGSHVITELIRQGHQVRAFDLLTSGTEKVAQRFDHQFEKRWGDLRMQQPSTSLYESSVIVHLAAVIPPLSEQPELAEQVNVGGTRHLIEAAKAQASRRSSSLLRRSTCSGYTAEQPPPRRASDPVQATDDYWRTRSLAALIKQSGLEYLIASATCPTSKSRIRHVQHPARSTF